jgi:hypothetical protein
LILLDKLNNLINTQPGRKAVTIIEKTDFVPSYKKDSIGTKFKKKITKEERKKNRSIRSIILYN